MSLRIASLRIVSLRRADALRRAGAPHRAEVHLEADCPEAKQQAGLLAVGFKVIVHLHPMLSPRPA